MKKKLSKKIFFKKIVKVENLKNIKLTDGNVVKYLDNKSKFFKKFGEVYFSTIKNKSIKAWKLHFHMTQLFVVPVGCVKMVIYDNRPNSLTYLKTQEFILSPESYKMVQLPPDLWYGFQGQSIQEALIVNLTDIVHSPQESTKRDSFDPTVPYQWS